MRDFRPLLRRVPAAVAAAAVLVHGAAAAGPPGQSAAPQALKAAFVMNFAKLADWPEDALPPGGQFRFCVVGTPVAGHAFRAALADQRKGPDPIVVELAGDAAKDTTELRACQMLYLTSIDRRQTEAVLRAVNGAPVFTVSDLDGFARMGGIAELYEENSRIRFAINVQSAQRARLRLGASLLSLAHIVKDGK